MKRRVKYALVILAALMILPPMAPFTVMAGEDDIAKLPNCPICGMDRHKFAHSRMLIDYTEGPSFGACSLHCAALELAYHPGKIPTRIQVADFGTHALVDVDAATWVIGGQKMGVMTANAKWAFAKAEDAQRFVEKEGGTIADFESAISAAFADMYKDTLMIREKRKKMKGMKHGHNMPQGKTAHN